MPDCRIVRPPPASTLPVGRLLMTTDLLSGTWEPSLALAHGLAAAGIRITLAVSGPPPDEEQCAEARTIAGLCLEHRAGRLEWMADSLEDVAGAGEWLLALAARDQVDLVHTHLYGAAALPFAVPVVLAAAPPPQQHRALPALMRRGLDHAALVVSAGHGTQPGAPPIPHGLDADQPEPEAARDDLILTAGRLWHPAHGIDLLDLVAPQIGTRLAAIGSLQGPDRLIRRLRHITPLGSLGRAQRLRRYRSATLFAGEDAFAALEAAASGCALVLANVPGLRAQWQDAACFVPPDNATAWRDALNRLSADSGQRADLAMAARIRARRHGAAAMVAGWLEAYRQAFDGAASPGGARPAAPVTAA